MMVADVVRAALEERERHRELERVAHERQVALEELVLQRLRAGGDDHLAAVEQGRHEIRERLAGAGAGFGDQRAAPAMRSATASPSRVAAGESESREARRRGRRLAQDRGELAVGCGAPVTAVERGVAQVALLVLRRRRGGLPSCLVGGRGGALSLLAASTAGRASRAR
jgi:hypothetical protein